MNLSSLQKLGMLFPFLAFCCLMLSAQEPMVKVVRWNNDNNPNDFYFKYSTHRDPCKVFIGVGTSTVSGGLKVDYTVDNTPATTCGVQAGDVITALDGVPVRSQLELVTERDKHQQGEAFTLTILRNGSEMTINARFKECSAEEMEQIEEERLVAEQMEEKMAQMREQMMQRFGQMETKERAILGVYENDDVSLPGMVIGSVIPGKGAAAAGLQSGDVVTRVNDKAVTGGGTLRAALANYKPGDKVTVTYQRDGQTLQTELTLSADRSFVSHRVERDPCAVFIGVYTGDLATDGRGVRVTGIVDGTPAKEGGVQPGDVIISLDDVPVNSHVELLRERNKHKPGDAFLLTVLREGSELNIAAQFKNCPKDAETSVVEKVEIISADEPEPKKEEKPLNQNNPLRLEKLDLYPNPTAGPLNVTFEAEAVPTTVRITDVAGKTVYQNVIEQFSGYFSERINLEGNTPGTYVLSIEQNGKAVSKKIVLLPRV